MTDASAPPASPQQQGPTLGQQLGLGVNWSPSPCGYRLSDAVLQAHDGSKIHIFEVHMPVGVIGIPLSDDDLRGLAKSFTERASGLVLAAASDALPPSGPLRTPGA